jgi:hypothetical protein
MAAIPLIQRSHRVKGDIKSNSYIETRNSAQVSLIAIVLIAATSEIGGRRRRRRRESDKKTPWTDARSPDLGEEC